MKKLNLIFALLTTATLSFAESIDGSAVVGSMIGAGVGTAVGSAVGGGMAAGAIITAAAPVAAIAAIGYGLYKWFED